MCKVKIYLDDELYMKVERAAHVDTVVFELEVSGIEIADEHWVDQWTVYLTSEPEIEL